MRAGPERSYVQSDYCAGCFNPHNMGRTVPSRVILYGGISRSFAGTHTIPHGRSTIRYAPSIVDRTNSFTNSFDNTFLDQQCFDARSLSFGSVLLPPSPYRTFELAHSFLVLRSWTLLIDTSRTNSNITGQSLTQYSLFYINVNGLGMSLICRVWNSQPFHRHRRTAGPDHIHSHILSQHTDRLIMIGTTFVTLVITATTTGALWATAHIDIADTPCFVDRDLHSLILAPLSLIASHKSATPFIPPTPMAGPSTHSFRHYRYSRSLRFASLPRPQEAGLQRERYHPLTTSLSLFISAPRSRTFDLLPHGPYNMYQSRRTQAKV